MLPVVLPRALSKREACLLGTLTAAGQRVFTIDDARKTLPDNGADVRKLLHRLVARRWLERLERGKYRLIPLEAGPEAHWAEHEYLLATVLVRPYYLAYATALYHYGYTERLPRPIWIATTRHKRSVTVGSIVYRFVTLNKRKFFGFATVELLDTRVQVAEREKAIIDGFDHPEYCGGVIEPAKGLWFGSDELDLEKLISYSQRLGNRTAMRRLGFWMEQLGIGDEGLWQKLTLPEDRNYALLDPRGPRDGPRNARWRLIVNLPERQLLEWREH